MNTSFPSVGIGILNWNGLKFLKALLPEINQLTYPNYTIYVIDNNSSDASVEFVKECHPNIKVIQLNKNYGFAGGYNRGFAEMKEDYYLMINSDVEVPKSFIEPLVQMMEADKNVAACQPKLLSLLNPKLLEHAGGAGGMIDFLGYPLCRGRLFDLCEMDYGQYDFETEIFWATGACCLIRRELYWKVSGMYEFFFMHSEEIDLCWRLIAQGYKIKFCPDSYIYHLGGGTLAYHTPRKTYLNFRNNIIMCFRNSPWYVNVWLLPTRTILDAAALCRFLIKEDPANCKAVIKAYAHFIKWMATEKNKFPAKKKSLFSIPSVLRTSVAWQYYMNNVKYYSELKRR